VAVEEEKTYLGRDGAGGRQGGKGEGDEAGELHVGGLDWVLVMMMKAGSCLMFWWLMGSRTGVSEGSWEPLFMLFNGRRLFSL
jgi:hypothetical protein